MQRCQRRARSPVAIVDIVPAPSKLQDPATCGKQRFRRNAAKQKQHLRGGKLDMTPKPWQQQIHLLGGRGAVAGRAPGESAARCSNRRATGRSMPASGRKAGLPARQAAGRRGLRHAPEHRRSPSAAPALPSANTMLAAVFLSAQPSSTASDVRSSSSVSMPASVAEGAACGRFCGGDGGAAGLSGEARPLAAAAACAAGALSGGRRFPMRRDAGASAAIVTASSGAGTSRRISSIPMSRCQASWLTRRSRFCEFAAMQLSVEFLTVAMRQKGNYCGCYCYHISR